MRMLRGLFICIVLGAGLATAQAQIGLPGRVPALPGVGLPGAGTPGGAIGLPGRLGTDVGQTLSGVGDSRDLRRLTRERQQRIAALIRRYPRLIERDPRGAAILRSEVVALAPSDTALDRARAAGFSIARDRTLGALGVRVIVLRAPDGLNTRRALEQLRRLDPAGTYDFNHLYIESGVESTVEGATNRSEPTASIGEPGAGLAATTARVGLIDSGIEVHHPVFNDVPIHLHGCDGAAVPAEHGTAVASLLVGRAAEFHGSAPGAALFAADVYCGAPTGGAVDTIVEAFDWVVQERVPVINVSLVGPPNALLAALVQRVIARGFIIVAAVGNDGPAAPPLYPAAYPGVVGVTGVDAHRHVLMEAERGAQVQFAAPGADMAAAAPPRAYALVRGTSFAAPLVAGLLARGLDPVYGYGLVGADLAPEPALARAR
jgi:hypothetical protein